MTGTNCDLFTHKSSRSYLNHLVFKHLYWYFTIIINSYHHHHHHPPYLPPLLSYCMAGRVVRIHYRHLIFAIRIRLSTVFIVSYLFFNSDVMQPTVHLDRSLEIKGFLNKNSLKCFCSNGRGDRGLKGHSTCTLQKAQTRLETAEGSRETWAPDAFSHTPGNYSTVYSVSFHFVLIGIIHSQLIPWPRRVPAEQIQQYNQPLWGETPAKSGTTLPRNPCFT